MANTCGDIEFLKGGTIAESTILNSQLTNSTISSSTVESSDLKTLSSIDASSAATITAKLTEAVENIRRISNAIAADEISSGVIGEALFTNPGLVRLLVESMAALPVSALAVLANALAESVRNGIVSMPTECKAGDMPAMVAGGGSYLLGEPDAWINVRGGAVPVYMHNSTGTIR